MPKTFSIVTLGCKVNRYESDRLSAELSSLGMAPGRDGEDPDVIVVNTCTVTGRAGQQSRQAVRAAIRANPRAVVIATGCHAQTDPDSLSGIENLFAVCGNSHKDQISRLVRDVVASGRQESRALVFQNSISEGRVPSSFGPPVTGRRSRPVLRIQDGCNSWCSYCTVPMARGKSRSMDQESVLRHLSTLFLEGYGEVVLTGIHIGAWGLDLDPASCLTRLLEELSEMPGLPRLRISSLEPNELTPGILALARKGFLCPHFHLPLQSGDDGILKLMGRPYTRAQYAGIVRGVRDALPLAAIGADVMVGFPGESEAAFNNTRLLLEELPLTYLHIFPFSPREGTAAFSMPGRIEPWGMKERTAVLREISGKKRAAFSKSQEGLAVEICVEGEASRPYIWKGLTENYVSVEFESIPHLRPGSLVKGRIAESPSEGPVRAVLEPLPPEPEVAV